MPGERSESKRRGVSRKLWLSREASVTGATDWVDEQLLSFDSDDPDLAATLVCTVLTYSIFQHAFLRNVLLEGDLERRPGSIGEFIGAVVGSKQQILQRAIDGDWVELRNWFGGEDYCGIVGETRAEPKRSRMLEKIEGLLRLIPDGGEPLKVALPLPPWDDPRFNGQGVA